VESFIYAGRIAELMASLGIWSIFPVGTAVVAGLISLLSLIWGEKIAKYTGGPMKKVIQSVILISFFLFLRIFFGMLGYAFDSAVLDEIGNAFLMFAVGVLALLLFSLKSMADRLEELKRELE